MRIGYEWDIETTDRDGDIIDHNHADRLRDLPTPSSKYETLVLVRTTEDGARMWAYVDDSRMLPRFFSVPGPDGHYHETAISVPQRFHREIAREMAR